MEHIVSDAQFEMREESGRRFMVAKAKGLESLLKLRTILRNESIRDAARRVMSKGATERSLVFYLNKQAAFVKHVSFSEPESESPLGPIKVTINCSDARAVLDWLAPKTRV